MKRKYCIATVDFETDPFLEWDEKSEPRIPKVFSWGFLYPEYQGYVSCWHENPIEQFINYIKRLSDWQLMNNVPEVIVYAHNGGKFDYHFIRHYIDQGSIELINGRIVKFRIHGVEFRDSYCILPVPLKKLGGKLDIKYSKMEYRVREKYKTEILTYLKADCEVLYNAVSEFREEFAPNRVPPMTMASTALGELMKITKEKTGRDAFKRLSPAQDKDIRTDFFYGGRCQCFEGGILKGPFKVYDVNSMYPYVMAEFNHPTGNSYHVGREITENTFFLEVEAKNRGAFLVKHPVTGELDFTKREGTFFITIHEYNAALETGAAKITDIKRTIDFKRKGNFKEFVYYYWNKRLAAKASGNQLYDLYYKLIPNSSYGKTAQDPSKFREYELTTDRVLYGNGWGIAYIANNFDYFIFEREASDKQKRQGFFNVALGASITGAARAMLLRGIESAKRPIYCDTDSVICESMNVAASNTELGGWKLEAEGDYIGIGGKKIYTLISSDKKAIAKLETDIEKNENAIRENYFVQFRGKQYGAVKYASKGNRLTPQELMAVAQGEEIVYRSPVPSFRMFGNTVFQSRKIRATHKFHA